MAMIVQFFFRSQFREKLKKKKKLVKICVRATLIPAGQPVEKVVNSGVKDYFLTAKTGKVLVPISMYIGVAF